MTAGCAPPHVLSTCLASWDKVFSLSLPGRLETQPGPLKWTFTLEVPRPEKKLEFGRAHGQPPPFLPTLVSCFLPLRPPPFVQLILGLGEGSHLPKAEAASPGPLLREGPCSLRVSVRVISDHQTEYWQFYFCLWYFIHIFNVLRSKKDFGTSLIFYIASHESSHPSYTQSCGLFCGNSL